MRSGATFTGRVRAAGGNSLSGVDQFHDVGGGRPGSAGAHNCEQCGFAASHGSSRDKWKDQRVFAASQAGNPVFEFAVAPTLTAKAISLLTHLAIALTLLIRSCLLRAKVRAP